MRLSLLSLVLSGATIVSGCVSIEDERRNLMQLTDYDICYAATDRRPFEENKKKAAAQLIREKNIQCDWRLFAAIHAAEGQRRAALVASGNAMMSSAFSGKPMRTCSTYAGVTTCD